MGISKLNNIKEVLIKIAMEYPYYLREGQLRDVDRIAEHINIVQGTGKVILDIGGGIGLFSVGCAALGMKVFLLDDFSDEINKQEGDSILNLHRSAGVTIIKGDALTINFAEYFKEYEQFDCITCFDAMEHFRSSPRGLLYSIKKLLKKKGVFLLGVPNAVDIFTRLKVLCGISSWSKLKDWYYPLEFRGHVREMTCSDLYFIAKDMGFRSVKIFGRNWELRKYHPRIFTRFLDMLLRPFPNLCSDIYLYATDYERSPIDEGSYG